MCVGTDFPKAAETQTLGPGGGMHREGCGSGLAEPPLDHQGPPGNPRELQDLGVWRGPRGAHPVVLQTKAWPAWEWLLQEELEGDVESSLLRQVLVSDGAGGSQEAPDVGKEGRCWGQQQLKQKYWGAQVGQGYLHREHG